MLSPSATSLPSFCDNQISGPSGHSVIVQRLPASNSFQSQSGAEIEEARWWTRADLEAAARAGELVVPRGISISSSLIESWYGRPLDGPGWD